MKIKIMHILLAGLLLLPTGCDNELDNNASAPTRIILSVRDITIHPGEAETLYYTSVPDGADIGEPSWESSAPEVATVDEGGRITAVAPGEALVRIRVGIFADQCIVRVIADKLQLLVPEQEEYQIPVGDTCTIQYETLPEYAEAGDIVWTSSDPDIAYVDSDGVITGMSPGETFVTMDSDGIKANCKIKVASVPLATGDILYSDGTTNPKVIRGKIPVGIVFYVGNPTADDPALAAEHPGCTHGLAVSVEEDFTAAWQVAYRSFGKTLGEWCEEYSTYSSTLAGTGNGDPVNKICGYNNTQAMNDFNSRPENYQCKINIAIERLYHIRMSHNPAPEASSGWYIPSAKEMSLLVRGRYDGNIWNDKSGNTDNLDAINRIMEETGIGSAIEGSGFWSSSEYDGNNAIYMNCNTGRIMEAAKDIENARVRLVLAF